MSHRALKSVQSFFLYLAACDSLSTVAALCEQADEQLFRSIKYKPTHPFQPLLPSERSTPYCTRPRPHRTSL